MKIVDLLKPTGILLRGQASSKADAYTQLIDLQEKSGNLVDKIAYSEGIWDRESLGSTAIGEGIAIPHAKNVGVKQAGLAAMTIPSGIDCNSLDGEPTKIFFMIAAPASGSDVHLEVLSRLSTMLMDPDFIDRLLAATTAEEFLAIIDEKETDKIEKEETKSTPTQDGYQLLAVTACPTGIAHTFMAAEALENKAKEMGYTIKVETNGSGGAKNVLTAEEIKNATGIIIAADKNVEMARFDGKVVVKASVTDGIHKPNQLIEKAMTGNALIYHHDGAQVSTTEEDTESVGRKLYKHLMNGVSHMLPFVIGGGILIAIAFLLDDYSIDPSNFGMNTPLAAWFKTVGGTAFDFMLPILAGYIAMSIADRPGLAVGFVGGTLAATGMTFAQPGGAISAGFLGALLAGFAGGYVVVGLRKLSSKLPDKLESVKPILIYPLIGVFLIALIMCAVNPFVAMLNTGLTDGLNSMGSTSKILLGCILGGMMSIDMGGPFNKAAYVFGTASLATGGFDIMAAVMVGGMIPPLAIALCCTFFKNRFTENEQKSGMVNYIMGLCFISEGAIPFAAADPLRVLPSCIIGSAVAGGLSMALGCTLRAPHGGIFVLPVIGNMFGFVIALVVGSIVGMALLAILKKPLK